METFEILQSIGLSKWESQTYLALLEIGETTTGFLVKESKVPQPKIYGVLDSLIKKGLVSYIIKGKIKYFQASDSKRLISLCKQKEEQVEKILKDIQIKKQKNQSVEIFEGFKAIKIMLIAIIQDAKKGEEFYGFSTGKTSSNKEIEEFYEWWGERKKISGLKDHLLISSENKKEFESNILEQDWEYVKKKTKYSRISFPGDVAIFRENVIMLNYETTPTAILIKSEEISKQYKDFFLGIWKKS
ncbi:MAG: TrmB family transcriptional regulator [Nanoarchaeota archaeon]